MGPIFFIDFVFLFCTPSVFGLGVGRHQHYTMSLHTYVIISDLNGRQALWF